MYGRRVFHKPVTDGGPQYVAKNPTIIDFKPQSDTIQVKRDFSWDNLPDSLGAMPQVKPYKIRLRLDSFWGGFAYSSSVGTVGNLEVGLSDIMGNHALGINLGIAGKIKDSNILLTYLYLPKRIDYGIGVFNLLDEVVYNSAGTYYYFRNRVRETGLYSLVRYPVNRFLRLDFENQIYSWENNWDTWIWDEFGTDDHWQNDTSPETDLIFAPALTLVHDNALYGSTGPLLGWRTYLTLRKSFAIHSNDYHTAYLDWRSYSLFNKRYAMALRLVGGFSGGKQPQTFSLNGYYGIRGYDKDDEGEKIALASAELRFPFLDYLSLAFPIPLAINNIRGSAFADIGSVWNDNKSFRGYEFDRLKDLHFGFGFGPRMNIGIAVMKLDIAWLTDFVDISKPAFYFSLTEDF
jgi:outer membrane protein assembly factor BamA